MTVAETAVIHDWVTLSVAVSAAETDRAFAAFILATVWEDLHRHRIEAGAESARESYTDYRSMIATSIVDGELRL